MVNYNSGKIYKLVSSTTDKIYISSTTQGLSTRMASHRRSLTPTSPEYAVMKYPDVKIVLIEAYSCDSRDALTARENAYIKKFSSICVNANIPADVPKDGTTYITEGIEVKLIDGDYYITVFKHADVSPRIITIIKDKPQEVPLV